MLGRACDGCDGIEVAYLFGSRARGNAHANSDLDLAVIYSPKLDAPGREEMRRALLARLEQALGKLGERADVVDLQHAGAALGFRILRDGVCVHVRDEALRVRTAARIMRRHDDEAQRRELFRRAALRAGERMQAAIDGG